jgi:LAO/AO transport system kinase
MKHTSPNWLPPVVLCSALKGLGLDALWEKIAEHKDTLTETGELQEKRRRQRIRWMWAMLENRLMDSLRSHPQVVERLPEIERDVAEGRLTITLAVDNVLQAFHN